MKPVYKVLFTLSLLLTITAIIVTAVFGLRFGVDFKGGSLMEVVFEGSRPDVVGLTNVLNSVQNVENANANPSGDKIMLIRLNNVNEQTHQVVLAEISNNFGPITENRFDSIGPVIGGELRSKSIRAIVILMLAIVVYIAFVFRKMSRVLSPWALGLAAVVALIHDIIVPIGVFSFLGYYYGVEITAVFVAAALTILGYSLSDSVVIFDRVRENVIRFGSDNFAGLVHKSVMQTMTRSINTTLTTLLALIAIFFFGGETTKYFSLALIIGIFSGAYSSFFIASPILVWLSGKRRWL